jgi:hypothetical protein
MEQSVKPSALYVVTSIRPKPTETMQEDELLSLPDADAQGRVLFRESFTDKTFSDSLSVYINSTVSALTAVANLVNQYAVDEVTLKLGVDASVGCVFVGDGKVEASIEVKLKRLG